MISNVIIRPALRTEIPKLHSVRCLCWKRAYGHIYEESEIDHYFQGGAHERRTWPTVEYENTETLAAEIHGIICGYAKFGWNTANDSELQSLYICPEHWNQGIGSQLWNRVLEMNHFAQVRSMNIWVLKRARSADFYTQKGCDLVDQGDYFIGDRKEVAFCYQWRP